ncbi:MAG: transposase [Candidatus Eremiobacteraeota bacterium]|nr:transposase [Candidatus Eremiobacteraeota bacterium]MCW5870341.1 transposase [Candidatus Eremiobacteraeota bacterium]
MFGGYHGLVQEFPCCDALGSFLRQQLSALILDLLELESLRLIAGGKAVCRNGYQQEQQLRLACGTLSLRRPRLRGAHTSPGDFLRVMRSRKSFHQLPYLFLLGLARREMGALQSYLGIEPDLWRAGEERFWARLTAWRTENLGALVQHCLILERLDFGPDHPQLLVALSIGPDGSARVIDARPGDASSSQQWSELCRTLKQRAIPAPILVKGAAEAALSHWPQATALEV